MATDCKNEDIDISPSHRLRESLAQFALTTPRRSSRHHCSNKTDGEDEDTLPVPTIRHTITRTTKVGKLSSQNRTSCATPKAEVLAVSRTTKTKSTVKKIKRGYAAPEQYAHLKVLPDYLKEEMDILFCGINPAVKSSQAGHHYANPTNHFWHCLHASRLTPTEVKLSASEDYTLPERFNFGLTNIVERPSAEAAELSPSEFAAGTPTLLRKIAQYRPRIVCFVGKGIWDAFERVVRANIKAFAVAEELVAPSESAEKGFKRARPNSNSATKGPLQFDIQKYKMRHPAAENTTVHETIFFVMPSTSGRVISHQRDDKVELCKLLKQRLEELRAGHLDTTSMAVVPFPTPP